MVALTNYTIIVNCGIKRCCRSSNWWYGRMCLHNILVDQTGRMCLHNILVDQTGRMCLHNILVDQTGRMCLHNILVDQTGRMCLHNILVNQTEIPCKTPQTTSSPPTSPWYGSQTQSSMG